MSHETSQELSSNQKPTHQHPSKTRLGSSKAGGRVEHGQWVLGMDDLGAREQFPSCLEVYTMYPPDTPGQPYVCSPDPELAELSTVLKLMGLSNRDEDWVSFV